MASPLASCFAATLLAAIPWIDPQAVKSGQRGVCITEWSGGERREIPVEVLGVLDATSPDRTTVLIRLLDPVFDGGGVAAGMSGSPVYIDGKLLGALAFGWAFAREPLAGVMPFRTMSTLVAGDPPVKPQAPTLTQLAAVANGTLAPIALLPELARSADQPPLALAVAGLPTPAGFAQQMLSRIGLAGVPSGQAPGIEGIPEPGEMLAVPMVWGDATLAAAGTVTARDGTTLWAFGHPFLNLGAASMPVMRARVLAIQGSYQSPFKLVALGKAFGRLQADRSAGIVVTAGEPPPGIPLKVTVHDTTGTASWSFRIAEVPAIEQFLVTYLVDASLTARGAALGEASVHLGLEVRLVDGQQVTMRQSMRGGDALARTAAFAGGVVGLIENTEFPHPSVTSIEARFEREETPTGASVIEVLPGRLTVQPGDELPVMITLQPHQRPALRERILVRVPAGASPGSVDLVVANGAAWGDYRLRASGVMPTSFADLIEELGLLEPSSTLVAALETRERGAALPGSSMPALPPSWSYTLTTGLGARGFVRLSSAILSVTRWQAPFPLEGTVRTTLLIKPRREEAP